MRSVDQGEWLSWSIDGRAGAKLCLGPVFLGEISYPHDFGLGARWRAWLNQEHLGYFRNEHEAKQYIEAQILKRVRLMQPAWMRFQARTQAAATPQRFTGTAAVIQANFVRPERDTQPVGKTWSGRRESNART